MLRLGSKLGLSRRRSKPMIDDDPLTYTPSYDDSEAADA
jgi:hypothetical protein